MGAAMTVLHVVSPRKRDGNDVPPQIEDIAGDAQSSAPVDYQVVEDPRPLDVVVERARQFDLVVVGVEEQWGLASHLFGWRPERLAADSPASMLIVRTHKA